MKNDKCRNGCQATAGPAKIGTELSRGGWGRRCLLKVLGSWVPETRNWELGTRNYDGPQDAQGGGVRILTFPY